MERLAGGSELIDDSSDPSLLAGTLRDLVRINRRLGGAELSWRALAASVASVGDQPVTLLDIGSGAADIPRHLLRRAAEHGRRLAVTATDVRPEIVELARRWSDGVAGLAVEQVAGHPLPYGDSSFDIVHASLVIHHLEPEAAPVLLAEMGRVCRRAVIVNDLERARRWWLAAWILVRVATRNPYTRHDAPLSVRRAYRPAEIARLAEPAGLSVERVMHDRLGHRFAVVLRPA